MDLIVRILFLAAVLLAAMFVALAIAVVAPARAQDGVASFYSTRDSGARTASGERLDDGAFTAAHKTLPFGARVRVINKRNGRTVEVRINDRGPFIPGRVIDVTLAGARALGFLRAGKAPVHLEWIR